MPKLSVLIATYNRAPHLIRTLESLLEQDLNSELWQIIIVDNNSSDSTKSSCEEFIASHREFDIKYFFEREQGLSYARNCGMANCQGDYIVFVDDDEIFSKDFLSAYYKLFESEPTALVAGGRVEAQYDFKTPSWLMRFSERPIAGTVNFSPQTKYFPSTRYPTGGNMAFRASVFATYGNFNTALGRKGSSLMGGEEKDLFERINAKIYYVYDALIFHIIPESRVSVEYVYKVASMVGVSERLRTKERGIYGRRLILEGVKWAGALVFALGYVCVGRFSAARVLLGMRWRTSKGLIK
ncbi:MAG: glycosyltransferase family 2 protein [Rikenellaceae bacterium]